MQMTREELSSVICPICQTACGFIRNGKYKRCTYILSGMKIRDEICRFLCILKRKEKKFPTFSILMCDRIPYVQYTITLIIALLNGISESGQATQHGKIDESTARFEEKDHLIHVEGSHIRFFREYIGRGMRKFQNKTDQEFTGIDAFLAYCNDFQARPPNLAAGLSLWFFEKTHFFLFGTGSQHRHCLS